MRVHELAKELGVSAKELMENVKDRLEIVFKSHSATVSQGNIDRIRELYQKPAEKKRLSMSKVLERTAIAVIACLSLCLIVFWLRDQIARNMDKWNMKQIKIGSFGIAEESLQEWQLSEINGLQYKQGNIQKRGNYDV